MEKLEVFYSKFFSALYIHFTVWADCVGESEIACLATLITLILLYVSLDQRNQSSSWTISWTESFIIAIFWLLNIYLTGRTQENIFLPIEWRLVTVFCYSLAVRAQATCLENRERKTVQAKFSETKEGNSWELPISD